MSQHITTAYQTIMQQIAAQCEQGNRPTVPTLIAVSKKQSIDAIKTVNQLGVRHFGENYLQEALQKQAQLAHSDIIWHFIGQIQRNKTKEIAQNFSWVHSVDRLIIAERLALQRPDHLPPLNICLQVNIDDETTKQGCAVQEVAGLVMQISQLANIRLRGLMVIPEVNSPMAFKRTYSLFNDVKQYHQHPEQWDTLSMGMSQDYLSAIDEGATMIRIGTALFGKRS